MKFLKAFISIMVMSFTCIAQNSENTAVPFTLADRDRIMSTEQKLEAFQKNVDERFVSLRNELNSKFDAIDTKFDAQQKQLDNMYTLLFFILGGIMSLIGFIIYDRRTAIKPVQREQENILHVLREYSKKHGDLAELLKNASIL